tara:strand:+ start:453 stop:1319 length:867 start_codon:yes stop_codon:yes gene_type:complete
MNIIILILPFLLISLIFIFPLIRYIWLSFHSFSVVTNLEIIPNGLSNWNRLILDSRFWQDVWQTGRFTFTSVILEIILAIIIALLLDQKIKCKGLIRSLSILPWALPTTIMALGWRWIFNSPYGPIEIFLKLLNIGNINILSNPDTAWLATVIADVWKTTPFVAIILLAGLQSIPNDLYEAFKLEGGNQTQSFFSITLPLLSPYILLGLIFRAAQAFGVFDLIQVMTGGGPAGSTESVAFYAYLNALRYLDFGYSSTIMIASFILLITLILLISLLINKSSRITSYLS